MRKYFYINLSILTLVTAALVSCDDSFIPDPIDPRIPKYTESGNNTAGAFINQEVWISQDYTETLSDPGWVLPNWYDVVHRMSNITVDSIRNSLILRFDGLISKDSTTLEFHIVGLKIYSFDDLAYLKDKKIQLDGTSNMGVYKRYYGASKNVKYIQNGGFGQLYIRNVSVVDSIKSATLSGTFGFNVVLSPTDICEIMYGRFDFTFQDSINLTIK